MIQDAPDGFEWVRDLAPSQATRSLIVRRGGIDFRCKRPSSRAAEDATARARAAREACILHLLGGRGAPELIASGDDSVGPYLVMAEVGLPALDTRSSRPWQGPAQLLSVARSCLHALARVHSASDSRGPLSVVHADLSPSNVLADEHAACIVDFGLSGFRDAPVGRNATFAGTLRYAAPELARGETIDVRADLFAMAATLLHVASGIPPRDSPSAAAMLALAAEQPMTTYLAACRQRVPDELLALLTPCLAFDPTMRPDSAAALAR